MADFPWCRLYNDVLSDRKIDRICRTTKQPRVIVRGMWMTLLAMANDSPQRGHLMWSPGVWVDDDEICGDLGMDAADFAPLMAAFVDLALLTRDANGLRVTQFDKRQFRSDLSTKRVQKHRAKKTDETPDPHSYATPGNNAETLPERFCNASDTDTEAETKAETETEADAPPAIIRITDPPPEPKPPPTLTQQEVDAYLETPDPVLMEHWPTLKLELQGQVTHDMYEQWIAPLRPLAMRDHTAFFCHPTTYGQEWCTSRLKPMIDRTVRAIVPDSMGSAVLVGAQP